LAERGVKVVHCPVSNLKLGAGVAPIPKMLERGVTVALGTDGACSNNSLNMFTAMKLAALLHKGVCRDPSLVKAEEALKMATVNGAAALGLDKSLGKLEPGFKADLVAFDFSHPHLKPLYDEVSHLVYAARSRDVKHMLVDGRLVVEDGVFKVLDVEEVVSKAVKEKEKLMRRLEEAGGRC